MDERFWIVHVSIAVIVSVDLALSAWKAWMIWRVKKGLQALGISFDELCNGLRDLGQGKRERVLYEVRRVEKPS